ncbi:hypothetical protein Dimus_007516 [Dionaea muscipula]
MGWNTGRKRVTSHTTVLLFSSFLFLEESRSDFTIFFSRGWALLAHRLEGTRVYKDRAFRSPFQKFAADSSVKLEIVDALVRAISFLYLMKAKTNEPI